MIWPLPDLTSSDKALHLACWLDSSHNSFLVIPQVFLHGSHFIAFTLALLSGTYFPRIFMWSTSPPGISSETMSLSQTSLTTLATRPPTPVCLSLHPVVSASEHLILFELCFSGQFFIVSVLLQNIRSITLSTLSMDELAEPTIPKVGVSQVIPGALWGHCQCQSKPIPKLPWYRHGLKSDLKLQNIKQDKGPGTNQQRRSKWRSTHYV